MRCQRAASPARGLRAPWVPRCQGRCRPPGARRAFARRDLITQSVLGTLQIAVSLVFMVFMVSPWIPALVFRQCRSPALAFHPGAVDL